MCTQVTVANLVLEYILANAAAIRGFAPYLSMLTNQPPGFFVTPYTAAHGTLYNLDWVRVVCGRGGVGDGWMGDGELRPPGPRRHRIAYMPRKWPGLAEGLRAMVAAPVEWFPIDGLGEAETAAALAATTVFLTPGRGEGFGLPPGEAMAAGCVACGEALIRTHGRPVVPSDRPSTNVKPPV